MFNFVAVLLKWRKLFILAWIKADVFCEDHDTTVLDRLTTAVFKNAKKTLLITCKCVLLARESVFNYFFHAEAGIVPKLILIFK